MWENTEVYTVRAKNISNMSIDKLIAKQIKFYDTVRAKNISNMSIDKLIAKQIKFYGYISAGSIVSCASRLVSSVPSYIVKQIKNGL